MPLITAKKLEKLIRDPRLFFQDAFEKRLIPLGNALKKYKPKKREGYSKYVIVSAVYNVEKYLDDYFKSIINQRLDFEKNIHIVCVDDGSTDNSANIIKSYQKKYPKNITYLYKENGGQASARNLGLKYLQENESLKDKFTWVTFTDPDDFLDNGYFYEVDEFLVSYLDDDICMIGCNIIFYHEKQKLYKDNHALNFKFKNGVQIRENYNLDDFIQLFTNSCFVNIDYMAEDIKFDEALKPNFEDAKFINEYLLKNINSKSAFLPKAKYFYRKREDGSSTLDSKLKHKDYYLNVTKNGYLDILQKSNHHEYPPLFIQILVLYDLYWQIKNLINSSEKVFMLNKKEREEYLTLLGKIFQLINVEAIWNFNNIPFEFYIIQGIIWRFRQKKFFSKKVFIECVDDKNEEILIKYYFNSLEIKEAIYLDGVQTSVKYPKIRQYDFLDEVFVYEKRIWLKLNGKFKDLSVLLDNIKFKIEHQGRDIKNLDEIYEYFKKLKKIRLRQTDLWLFSDMSSRADDNAEHLYRYIMQNYPKQKIIFVLRKDSEDWNRLEQEGFKLIDPRSLQFKYVFFRANKIISSHIDKYMYSILEKNILKTKDFVFLQHGIIHNDLSKWLNQKNIDVFITSTYKEYHSIVDDFSRYKFSSKEVILTGMPRHDALLKNNKVNTKQILIMPTWRQYLNKEPDKNNMEYKNGKLAELEYFVRWREVLQSSELRDIIDRYGYKIVFKPHPQVKYIENFMVPDYITLDSSSKIQEFFCNSDFMITDYSSVAFEMAYLNKYVIYYQFDEDEFFLSHTVRHGYFDYRKDGFGPVVCDKGSLIREIKRILNSPYMHTNAKVGFKFRDNDNCKRVFNVVSEIFWQK